VALQHAEEHQTLQILLDAVPVKAPFIPPAPSSRPPYAVRARTSR
jgi:hypothetical protein